MADQVSCSSQHRVDRRSTAVLAASAATRPAATAATAAMPFEVTTTLEPSLQATERGAPGKAARAAPDKASRLAKLESEPVELELAEPELAPSLESAVASAFRETRFRVLAKM